MVLGFRTTNKMMIWKV